MALRGSLLQVLSERFFLFCCPKFSPLSRLIVGRFLKSFGTSTTMARSLVCGVTIAQLSSVRNMSNSYWLNRNKSCNVIKRNIALVLRKYIVFHYAYGQSNWSQLSHFHKVMNINVIAFLSQTCGWSEEADQKLLWHSPKLKFPFLRWLEGRWQNLVDFVLSSLRWRKGV